MKVPENVIVFLADALPLAGSKLFLFLLLFFSFLGWQANLPLSSLMNKLLYVYNINNGY